MYACPGPLPGEVWAIEKCIICPERLTVGVGVRDVVYARIGWNAPGWCPFKGRHNNTERVVLSKRVCRSCIDRERLAFPWDEVDEGMWEHAGGVYCSEYLCEILESDRELVCVNLDPPSRCRYAMEHVVDMDACEESVQAMLRG